MHAQLVPPQEYDTDAVLTIPNVVSFVRLLAVPAFSVLIILGHDVAAVILLAAFGATDWVDGFLARRLKQRTALGAKLDPVADRLYILAAVVALLVRGIVPIWFVVVLLARDVMLALTLPQLKRHGMVALPVNWIGKTGTFLILLALPLILLGSPSSLGWVWAHWAGWIFGGVGAVAYWVAGLLYVREAVRLGRGEAT
ncbi:CDP-diacylglycerol--glycerol-3-phosphate 3-phosphatidyltransferase [Tessaracoccus aquimaris]|uniref:CDP-diacylglycerol--glycerol-3-phosphate 3-phosphatidyltransferase n=1 Tax=Tessaracoccus aquimaris TaxID=1332264 RepID=A0A1Q2CLP6_9ACTN|nr:CDP-alcohol phosphatidyltransferase family protein [Tessaracoccus aquimaris]AQP47019.1 CDP-diacylglycerol--glycerol-3-phosphate 3-phosphatidyltransferase [Tessaracoccus aquimaris]